MAQIEEFKEDGEVKLILNEDQYISLANYMEELETEIRILEAELEQAEKEIDIAYSSQGLDISNLALGGAAIAGIIAILAN